MHGPWSIFWIGKERLPSTSGKRILSVSSAMTFSKNRAESLIGFSKLLIDVVALMSSIAKKGNRP
jgi:hypothetical protein